MRYTVVLIFLLQLLHARGNDSLYFHKSMSTAIKEAKKTNKLIFVDAYATWCSPCKRMSQVTFTDQSVISFVNEHFVCVKLDMERGEGIKFAQLYDVAAYPTLLFTDFEGKMLHCDAGYKDAAMFLNVCRSALHPEERLSSLDEKFQLGQLAAGPLLRYIEKRTILMNCSQDKAVDAFLNLMPDWKQDSVLDFVMRYVVNPGSPGFLFLLENKALFSKKFGVQSVNGRIEHIVYEELTKGNHRSGVAEMEKVINLVYPQNAERPLLKYKTTYYAAVGDAKAYMMAVEAYTKKYPPEDPSEWADLSNQLSRITDYKPYLKTAMIWTQEALKKEDNLECRMAMAFLYHSLGKRSKAKSTAKKALVWARENGESTFQAEQFLSTIM